MRTSIQQFMTALPVTVGREQSIAFANVRMHEAGVRHLPVLEGGKLVGVLSERDIALIEGLPGANLETLRVGDAMTEKPFTCAPTASLAAVAKEMAEKKYGSALVAENDKVLGIFTTVDALHALADLLHVEKR